MQEVILTKNSTQLIIKQHLYEKGCGYILVFN